MKTKDLIKLIAEDTRRPVNLRLTLLAAITGGASIAAAAFFSAIGFRHDIGQAIETVRFVFKFFVTLSLLATAAALLAPVIRPGQDPVYRRWFLLTPAALLLGAVVLELVVTPSNLWATKLVGQNALHCLTIIPILSLFTAVPLFLAMRQGAPENPGFAGIVAALASVGVASTLYASNCFDDSPLFVATWYPMATVIVATVGYFAGKHFLRW
ncbi:NrsF family protein [Sinorhizobium mexicanum]|uniref:DUF1109 family protein n=1 Tax=Sinorhizobium mexicanum TaxID=375549 RepID=A0A859R3H8_9HYPH|nr:NrsF family protein [Sinorhizobium mexicanum]MBP1886603.1 hypothetical protein [Sinorhizobium mexicanum]QLL64178.1 DUF1109 family protein [Sinorhizobium mexicanum]